MDNMLCTVLQVPQYLEEFDRSQKLHHSKKYWSCRADKASSLQSLELHCQHVSNSSLALLIK